MKWPRMNHGSRTTHRAAQPHLLTSLSISLVKKYLLYTKRRGKLYYSHLIPINNERKSSKTEELLHMKLSHKAMKLNLLYIEDHNNCRKLDLRRAMSQQNN